MARAWLTQSGSIPARTVKAICLPDDPLWEAQFLGAIVALTEAQSWETHGALSAEEMSDEWRSIFVEYIEGACSMIPVGTILEFAGVNLPAGFLWCDFAAVSRSFYAGLFAEIGETFGPGDGSTTFNLPDRRGRVAVGLDEADPDFDTLGASGGAKNITLTLAQSPIHTHVQNDHNHLQNAHLHAGVPHNHTQNPHTHIQNPHTHTVFATIVNVAAGGVAIARPTGVSGDDNKTSGSTTPTNQNATATNQETTTGTVSFTAINQASIATNQNAGGGESHSNLQPYHVSNFIIKY
jgi:microcystin-dependent protein